MAINFLNSVDFNKNELLNPRIENQANDTAAGTSVDGQLYFNTSDNVLKVSNGSGGWKEIGGNDFLTGLSFNTTNGVLTATVSNQSNVTVDLDGRYALSSSIPTNIVESITAGTYLTNAGTAADVILNHDATSRSDTTSSDSPGYGGTFQAVTGVTTNATGHVTAINVATYELPDESQPTITLTGEVTGSGTTNISTTVANGILDVANFNATAIVTEAEGIENNNNDTTIPTSAAVKDYVDNNIVGGLVYQGGYNAATNTPDLDSSPSSNIKKGWTYTVTADGSFFTEQVRVGDVLIAENDAPTTLAEWTTVQNNVDLASLTQVGIGNVNAGSGITVTYSNGTATVSHDGTNQSAKRVNLNNTVNGVTRGESGGITTFTIDVSNANIFGGSTSALDVMVEVIGNAVNAGDTVYAETGRSGSSLTVKFTGSVANGDYQALLNNVA